MKAEKLKIVPAHQAKLIFRFNNYIDKNSRVLELGKIKLESEDKNLLFQATSGLPGFQNLGSSIQRGKGRIPTCKQAGIANYFVSTKPVYLPNTKGVNGNFYPITPFVVSVGGYQRSDLGIHKDANVPGSAGCIVLGLPDHWKGFESEMKALYDSDVLQLPLIVF